MNKSLIFLIGYMGSGKSTIGKELAKKLNYDFVDMDNEIERKTGLSINTIFETHGELGFRIMEQEYLLQFQGVKNTIVSTGGGTPCFFNNMDFMNEAGTTFYLKLSVGSLTNRLMNAKGQRPLVKNKSTEELHHFITEMLVKREPYYSQAHYTLKGENLKVIHFLEALQLK